MTGSGGILLGGLLLALAMPAGATAEVRGVLDGAWFPCEFAHSRTPPPDGCAMLDDDGFVIAGGRIDHVKVLDSKETGCRHGRMGHCFPRRRPEVTARRFPVGEITPTKEGLSVTFLGCTQSYGVREREGFFEIAAHGASCFWTADRHYYVARFNGRLWIAED